MNDLNQAIAIAEMEQLNRQYNVGLAMQRLMSNRDFLLVLDDIKLYKPAQLTKQLAVLVKHEKSTDTIVEELKALSFFQIYFNQLILNGNSAKESLEQEED